MQCDPIRPGSPSRTTPRHAVRITPTSGQRPAEPTPAITDIAVERARAALGDYLRAPVPDETEASDAVRRLAARLRDDGAAPEQALAAVKRVTRDAGGRGVDRDALSSATRQVVRWFIDEYYRPLP